MHLNAGFCTENFKQFPQSRSQDFRGGSGLALVRPSAVRGDCVPDNSAPLPNLMPFRWLKAGCNSGMLIVRVGQAVSASYNVPVWSPTGSVLGPPLVSIYISPICHLTISHMSHFSWWFPALCSAFSSARLGSVNAFGTVFKSPPYASFCYNGFCLNPDKSEDIFFGTRQRTASFKELSIIFWRSAVWHFYRSRCLLRSKYHIRFVC